MTLPILKKQPSNLPSLCQLLTVGWDTPKYLASATWPFMILSPFIFKNLYLLNLYAKLRIIFDTTCIYSIIFSIILHIYAVLVAYIVHIRTWCTWNIYFAGCLKASKTHNAHIQLILRINAIEGARPLLTFYNISCQQSW